MKKLEKSFTKKGFRYSQMWRNDKFAIYLQENNISSDANDYYFCYEFIKIRIQKEDTIRKIFGKTVLYPAGEYYPNDIEWGLHGWTCFTEKEAMELKVRKQAFLSGRKKKPIVYHHFPDKVSNLSIRQCNKSKPGTLIK